MYNSEIHTIHYPDGAIERVQCIRFDSWKNVDFLLPDYSEASFTQFCNIYKNFLVPAKPVIFGRMLLFSEYTEGLSDELAKLIKTNRLAELFDKELHIGKSGLSFKTNRAKTYYEELKKLGRVEIVRGKLPFTKVIAVSTKSGFLSDYASDDNIVVNSNFFIMDPFDCATKYDKIAIPFGLLVKDGHILNPPLFEREALCIYNNGTVKIITPKLTDLTLEIEGRPYPLNCNAYAVYSRPKYSHTPLSRNIDVVIIGNKIVDVRSKGHTDIPASGFVLNLPMSSLPEDLMRNPQKLIGKAVIYHGYSNMKFAVQVGNSLIKDGKVTDRFISPFYNIYKPFTTPFPPSLYPLDYENARAARIALGTDVKGLPVLIWAEGAGKLHYDFGIDSCGASLAELAKICADLELTNAVNLDGGGSAQILTNKRRFLKIVDRNPIDNSDSERAVPVGIIFKEQRNLEIE